MFILLQNRNEGKSGFIGGHCTYPSSFDSQPSEIYGENDQKLMLLPICSCSWRISVNKKAVLCPYEKKIFPAYYIPCDSLHELSFECILLFVPCDSVASSRDFIISLLTGFFVLWVFVFYYFF